MVSIEVSRRLQAAAVALVAAGACSLAVFSQPVSDSAAARVRQLSERIEQEQSRNGPHSEGLIEPLTALALRYQEDGDRDLAAAAIEEATQVVRANYGLHSLEQAPLLEQAIRNEESRGDAETAWDLEQELLSLVAFNRNDLRTVPILHEMGDKRMDLLERYFAGEIPPQIVLGCYYGNSCVAGSRGRVIRSIVKEAKSYYAQAVYALLENGRYSGDEIEELLAKLVRSSYRYGDYRGVGPVFRRIIASESDASSSVPPRSRTDTLIQAADWDVLLSNAVESLYDYDFARQLYGPGHDERERAGSEKDYDDVLALYEQAYRQLESQGIDRASIEALFSPKIPIVLPTVFANPLVSGETADSKGYIDVAFEITRRGKARRVEILDTTSNASSEQTKELVRRIRLSLFRPRITNGQVVDRAPVVFRYYLSD
jgi:hypothetical protein